MVETRGAAFFSEGTCYVTEVTGRWCWKAHFARVLSQGTLVTMSSKGDWSKSGHAGDFASCLLVGCVVMGNSCSIWVSTD